MKRKGILFILTLITAGTIHAHALDSHMETLIAKPFTPAALASMPIPSDFRSYFILQSIDNTTSIIIGNFIDREKTISLITDEDGAGRITSVAEFYPEQKKTKTPSRPSTSFFDTGFRDMKKKIIDGQIFKEHYSYHMVSIGLLREKLANERNILKVAHGYKIDLHDNDTPSRIHGYFFFGKHDDRYDLLFATYHYFIFNLKITPAVTYSVYCKNSSDPVVAEAVEGLLKLLPQDKKEK